MKRSPDSGNRLTTASRRILVLLVLLATAGLITLVAMGYRPLVVYGGSMNPAISTGSVVLVRPVRAESLNVGDVIAVALNDTRNLITHRVQAKQLVEGRWLFQTKGDANNFPDPQPFFIEGAAGKVSLHIPWAGYAVVYASSPLIRSGLVGIFVYLVLVINRRGSTAEGGKGQSLLSSTSNPGLLSHDSYIHPPGASHETTSVGVADIAWSNLTGEGSSKEGG